MYRHWIAFHISAMQGACTVVTSTSTSTRTLSMSTSTSTSTRNLYSSCTRVRVRVPSTTSLLVTEDVCYSHSVVAFMQWCDVCVQ